MLHLLEQLPVELEPELFATVGEQAEVDGQCPEEVADEHAEGALVEDDHKEDRRADRDQDVCDARDHVRLRPLLHAEERGQLPVVHLRPQADERCADEVGAVGRTEDPVRDLAGEDLAEDQPDRRCDHREPERGTDDEELVGALLRIEVVTEERALRSQPQEHGEHGGQRDQRPDRAVVGAGQVPRVERRRTTARIRAISPPTP